jgi:IS5 family transposase
MAYGYKTGGRKKGSLNKKTLGKVVTAEDRKAWRGIAEANAAGLSDEMLPEKPGNGHGGRRPGAGRIKGRGNKTPDQRTAAEERKVLARKAVAIERKAAAAKAAERKAIAARKLVAWQVMHPALEALEAAVAALKTLMEAEEHIRPPKPPRRRRPRPSRSLKPKLPVSETPPVIRMLKDIIAEDGVGPAEAKRIQEREILARAEWKPPVKS